MENDIIKSIIRQCLSLDLCAVDIYSNLAVNCADEKLKRFWNSMLKQEKTHVSWWNRLLKMSQKSVIPQIFHAPENTLKELMEQQNKIKKIVERSSASSGLKEQFLLAFRLEFYLLHPALDKLLQFLDVLETQKIDYNREYNIHVSDFITAMRDFGASTPELEIIGEVVDQMWTTIKEMSHDSIFDELTQIFNRRGLFSAMNTMAYLAKRNSLTSGLLLIDIDRFKEVNDKYGHQVGDTVLVSVADLLSSAIRHSDILGRYGGEEFIIFFPQTKPSFIHSLAEKIRLTIESKTKSAIPVTISIGAVSALIKKDVEEEISLLIKRADECLYQAKREGRNKVVTN